MIKGSIQEDITIVYIYAPNIGATQYIRQILFTLKKEKLKYVQGGTMIPMLQIC